MTQLREMFHLCKDLGMWAIDRAPSSCAHKTEYCSQHCYMNKLKVAYKGIAPRRLRDELFWDGLTGPKMREYLERMERTTLGADRFRGCTDGENFATLRDVYRWSGILRANPGTLFWLPTRAWRNRRLRTAIKRMIMTQDNARVLASIDPSNSPQEIDQLVTDGWSTMFFGDDNESPNNGYRCPKTWKHATGHCSKCKVGCFSSQRVDIWLKSH